MVQTNYFSVHGLFTVPCVTLRTALLEAAWILLNCSDALPSLWIWHFMCCIASDTKDPFVIRTEIYLQKSKRNHFYSLQMWLESSHTSILQHDNLKWLWKWECYSFPLHKSYTSFISLHWGVYPSMVKGSFALLCLWLASSDSTTATLSNYHFSSPNLTSSCLNLTNPSNKGNKH